MVNVDISKALIFDKLNIKNQIKEKINQNYHEFINQDFENSKIVGWVDYTKRINPELIRQIQQVSDNIRQNSDVLLVIGIGGSYLGAKAVISALKPYFEKDDLEIIFVGNNVSSTYISELVTYLDNKDFSINVISKSGTTLEPAIAFRIFRDLLIKKYGDNHSERIIVTTDKEKGTLKQLANLNNYQTFVIPDNIGGRYSVFTPVGLVPICASGINITKLIEGVKRAQEDLFKNQELLEYALIRNVLYQNNYLVETLVSYEPKLMYFSEWFKQLFGESEGKDAKGIYPSSLVYTTDLHSLGQYVQDGNKILFETVINITNPNSNLTIKENKEDLDKLNYLASKSIDEIAKCAMIATIDAHVEGGVPNILLTIEELDEYHIGYLMYFMMFSCAISALTLGVDPFNQPGVENYKQKMFSLLKK